CASTFLHHEGEQFHGRQRALANGGILFILLVKTLELVLISKERFIKPRNVVWREQRDLTTLNEPLVHQAVDLHTVIEVADTVLFHPAVVLQHQQRLHFQVPQRVEQGGGATTHAALRARLHCGLEHLEEGQAAGVLRFTTANLAAERADAAAIDADARALRDITHDGTGGRIDAVQAVVAFDQHAGAELTRGRTHTRHNGCGERNLESGNSVVKALDVAQASFARVLREQAHRHQNVQELRALVDLLGDAVLYQVLAFQLFNGGI